MDRRTLAERDADYERDHASSTRVTREPFNIRVTIKQDSMLVEKVHLDGTLFTGPGKPQYQAERFIEHCQHLMHDIIDEHFIAGLHEVAHKLFVQRQIEHFNELQVVFANA